MPDTNRAAARLFERIADALELKGETGFRVLAYRKAARVLDETTADVRDLDREGQLGDLPGIGEALRKKIAEFLATGKMAKHDEAVADLPAGLFELLEVPGLGPRTVRQVWQELGVTDAKGLKRAIDDGSFAHLPGQGKKKATRIAQGLRTGETTTRRMYLPEAFELAGSVVDWLNQLPGVRHCRFAGSLRRGQETIGDIDVLLTGPKPEAAIERFKSHPRLERLLAAGETRASGLFHAQYLRQVDLRVLEESAYGAALQYFTGSKEHNVALRALAQQQGLKLSEYGLFKGERRVAGRTEAGIYRRLGLAFIEPELRTDRGELAAAAEGRLPKLLTLEDIRADLHVHTTRSDGVATLQEMAASARKRGYTHLAVADHSRSAHYAGGLSEDDLLRHCDEVDRFNRHSRGFKVLRANEVDIRIDGTLDYPDSTLERLDFVVASVHQGFKKDVTRRICAALEHPLVHCVAHPTGRLIDQREGYDVDVEAVIECAARLGKALEINSFYGRLDLSDIWARRAAEAGALLSINTDAHSVEEMDWMRYGVLTARRAWLEPRNVINCLSLAELKTWLKKKRVG
jgi:DNA polymerase (family 10)